MVSEGGSTENGGGVEWERRIVGVSRHSSFVGLTVRWSREAGPMGDVRLRGWRGGAL